MRLIIAFVSIMSSLAFGNQCLEDATHSELINELSRRLYSGGHDNSLATMDFTCRAQYLDISHITSNGVETLETVDMGHSSYCSDYRSTLSSAIYQIQHTSVLFAVCRSQYLHRFSASTSTLSALSVQDFGHSSYCTDKAREINSRL